MATHSIYSLRAFPQVEEPTPQALSPLVEQKYYNNEGKRLLFDFIREFLGVEIIGFQQGFAHVPDQIIFRSPVNGSTLAVPCSVMLLSHGQAVETVQAKIKTNEQAFR